MTSWNSSHGTVGCSQEALAKTGGSGLFYCFVADSPATAVSQTVTFTCAGDNATGCAILGTLLDELEVRQQRYGLATLCVGGGMGIATIIERL